jgi:hypothetical protein
MVFGHELESTPEHSRPVDGNQDGSCHHSVSVTRENRCGRLPSRRMATSVTTGQDLQSGSALECDSSQNNYNRSLLLFPITNKNTISISLPYSCDSQLN